MKQSTVDEGVTSVEISGEFDLTDAEKAQGMINDALERDALLLDLSRCDFIDSSGIRVLIRSHDRARKSGTAFAIAGSGPQVRRLFELTGLLDALPIFEERESALSHIAESAIDGHRPTESSPDKG